MSTFSLPVRRLTPADVLAIFVDIQRHQAHWGDVPDFEAPLQFETPVAEWRYALDVEEPGRLGEGLNQWFGTSFSKEEWASVLQPEENKPSEVSAI
jgi:hypothetical protein